jgi:non-homologous end joining protein Ku
MATKFKFEIESDGLTNHQTAAFSKFIETLGGHNFTESIPVNGAVDLTEVLRQEAAHKSAPAKKRRAPKFEVPESPGVIEDTQEAAYALDQQALNKTDYAAAEAQDAARQKAYNLEMAEDAQEAEAAQMVADAITTANLKPQETEEAPEPSNEVTLEMLKRLVSAKQANHRDTIKAYFTKRDGARTSTLPEKFYLEFYDLLTNLA